MKNSFVALLIFPFLFSCNQKENLPITTEPPVRQKISAEADSLKAFEEALDEVAVGGEGVTFEDNGKMSFDIKSLESTAKQTEAQLERIKSRNDYDSEDSKQQAIHSMELNLKLFQGTFCCTTHEGKHCADSKELQKLDTQYGCKRFMKKE